MSRVWYHYPNRVKTVWPAGTLPHGDSVFMADFLNQYVSWSNYLSALTEHPINQQHVSTGSNIQQASFWQSFLYRDQVDAYGYSYHAPKPFVIDEITDDIFMKLRDSAEWILHSSGSEQTAKPAVGDIIQPQSSESCLKIELMKKRARLDLMKNICAWAHGATMYVCKWRFSLEESLPSGTFPRTIPNPSYLAYAFKDLHSPVYWKIAEYEEGCTIDPAITRLGVSTVPCSAHYGYSSVNVAAYNSWGKDSGFVDTNNISAEMNLLITDYIPSMPPSWVPHPHTHYLRGTPDYPAFHSNPPNNISTNCYAYLCGIMHPLDELPAEYLPP